MSEFRKGICKDCRAEFNIPASFPHDRAKCRQCGGTVEIAAAAGAETKPEPKPEPVPAATPPAPKPKPKPKPVAPKPRAAAPKPKAAAPKPKAPEPEPKAPAEPAEKPMTMKEKIIARKKAEAEAAAAAAQPAAPAKQAAPTKQPAPKAKATPTAKRAKKDDSSTSGSRRKPAGKRSGAKRGKGGADEESGGRRGRKQKPEKKAPIGGIIGIAVLVIGGGAGWYFMAGPGKAEPKKAETVAAGETDEPLMTDAELAAEEAAKQAEAEAAAAEAKAAEAAKAEAKAPKKPKVYEPMAVTYDAIPIFGPAVGTTDEEWATLQELTDTAADMRAGARQGRASKKLLANGYKSVPAILNAFREVDLSDDEGNRLGDLLQRTITDLLNGKNAGWLYDQEDGQMIPRAHAHNRKVVLTYLKMWNEVVKDPTAWIGIAKLGTAKYADQLAAYSEALLADGITDGEFFKYVIGGGADASAPEEDDLDDF